MPSSATRTRVSGSSRRTVSGSPSSLLRLASAATVGVTAAQRAPSASFVVVFPVDPTTATTSASERLRTRPASVASACSWSSGTRSLRPAPIASSTNRVPVLSATKRSPERARRESSWTRRITPSSGRPASRPSPSASTSSHASGITAGGPGGRRARSRGRRTDARRRRSPAPARGPCRRSRRRHRPRRVRSRSRSPSAGRGRPRRRSRLPCSTSPMISSGSSDRGLSLVTITESASCLATCPICGRLARSRSPPAPKTTISFPSPSGTGGLRAPLRARPACGRSRRPRRTPDPRRPPRTARQRLGPPRFPRRSRSSSTSSSIAAATAARTFSTLKIPGRRRLDRDPRR